MPRPAGQLCAKQRLLTGVAAAARRLPGWAKALPSDEYSGYLDAGGGKHLHYMLVASESPTAATDPVVICAWTSLTRRNAVLPSQE